MATAETSAAAHKQSAIKTIRSKFARTTKALEIALNGDDRDNIPVLKDEALHLYDLYVRETTDLQCMTSDEQTEVTRALQSAHTELNGLLSRMEKDSAVAQELRSSDRSSRRSKRSSRRRIELARMKLAEAEKRQELERRQQQLDNEQAEIKRQLEINGIQFDLARSELESDSDSNSSSSTERENVDLPRDAQDGHDRVQQYVSDLPSMPANTDRKTEFSVNAELLSGFKNMTVTMQESFSLPKPELLTFHGSPADYCKFISNFETNVELRVHDDRMKLSYLIQHCQGEARRAIEDCVILPCGEGFNRAKQILKNRYGKPHLIARSHVDRLIHGNPVRPNDVQGLMNLSLDMEKCQITLSQIGFISDINNTENLRKIVRRLPMHIRSKWTERASKLIEQGSEPNFNDLLTFVQERVQVANTMYGQDLAKAPNLSSVGKGISPRNGAGGERHTSLSTTASGNSSRNKLAPNRQKILTCVYCQGGHKLLHCEKFRLIDLSEKLRVIRRHTMCENCLNFKHSAEFCRKRSCCEVSGCDEKHNTMLHTSNISDINADSAQSNCCAAAEGALTQNKVSLRIVPVMIENGPRHVKTYALLDEGSDVSLCTEELVRKLGATGKPREFTITTVSKTSEHRKGLELPLTVSSIDGNETVALNRVWSVERLPISMKSLPDRSIVGKWKHLNGINLPRINEGQVELLIGSDTPEVFWVEEQRRGKRGEPYAIRSILGWSILGPTGKCDTQSSMHVNFQQSSNLQIDIDKLWKTDFPDCRPDASTGMSVEDRRALSIMEKTLDFDHGHYKIGLPWRDHDVYLPKRKLLLDDELCTVYKKTMSDYIRKGYAIPVQNADEERDGKVWYLPHHPVTNPNKPGKVRIVFDCAARYEGTSLNENILQGPDFINSIVGVLMRFRKEPVALVADIEAMFHQVKVRDKDRDALRFLWWRDGDMKQEPTEYCMTVHLFGATSSPSCAGYSLKRTARDNADEFSEEAVKTVERNFYVDDLLKSVPSTSAGIALSSELRELLSRGGFRLTKWLSNDTEVMASIPDTEKAEVNMTIDIETKPEFERTLGLQWSVVKDQFVFDVCLQEKKLTRRGILSVASSLYDPLGLVAPVTLIPKLILQNACRQKLQWDEPITDTDAVKWSAWLLSLPELAKISIDRCLKPKQLDCASSRVELHMFSDASETAYGSAVYIKIYDVAGNSKCSLLIGKSRLAPIKSISIPRLELAAAVLSVKLYECVRSELDLEINDKYFWTDSMIVLGYIRNEKRRSRRLSPTDLQPYMMLQRQMTGGMYQQN